MRAREAFEIFVNMTILPNNMSEYEATRIVQEYIQAMLEQNDETEDEPSK